jgi:hypothetical protein
VQRAEARPGSERSGGEREDGAGVRALDRLHRKLFTVEIVTVMCVAGPLRAGDA